MAEEIIDSTFFNTYMSDLDELEKHRFGEDEPAMAEEAELDPHWQRTKELREFMDADNTRDQQVQKTRTKARTPVRQLQCCLQCSHQKTILVMLFCCRQLAVKPC